MDEGAILTRCLPEVRAALVIVGLASLLTPACGAGGGDPAPAAEVPSRGASGWPIEGEVVHEPAKSLSFEAGQLVVDESGTADADAGHPHLITEGEGSTTFHTCGVSICRDGVVIVAPDPDQQEGSVCDPFVRRSVSPLGRALWDMWFVTLKEGDRPARSALAFAGSFDGHAWSRYPDSPILSPSGGVASPWVEREPGGDALYVITAGKAVRRFRRSR